MLYKLTISISSEGALGNAGRSQSQREKGERQSEKRELIVHRVPPENKRQIYRPCREIQTHPSQPHLVFYSNPKNAHCPYPPDSRGGNRDVTPEIQTASRRTRSITMKINQMKKHKITNDYRISFFSSIGSSNNNEEKKMK